MQTVQQVSQKSSVRASLAGDRPVTSCASSAAGKKKDNEVRRRTKPSPAAGRTPGEKTEDWGRGGHQVKCGTGRSKVRKKASQT